MRTTFDTNIILIDGRSGSGKTTFARALAHSRELDIVHMDDLYPGWKGLSAGAHTAAWMSALLAAGHPARYSPWNWHNSTWDPERTLHPGGTIVFEGCGSLNLRTAPFSSERYWLDVPAGIRRERATSRDQDDTWWADWQALEEDFYAQHQPWRLATKVLT
ncbi:AAA family ATPase [Micrococcoides hystricis]|uniref:AAA family ATPase n=1 Tax=Micrococcoides hystricis TaxID=1572761 RepID=A0ABV6P7Q9_9MICC